MKIFYYQFLPLFFVPLFTSGTESNVIGPYDNPGTCICDVTLNSCDYFCCCDQSCTSSIHNFWLTNCALQSYSNFGSVYCADNSEIYAINSRRGMQTTNSTSSGLQCIQIDNSALISSFYSLVSSISTTQISQRTLQANTYKNTLAYSGINYKTSYSPGDVISQFVGQTSDVFGNCMQTSVAFLENISLKSCNRAGTIQNLCSSYLSTSFYSSASTLGLTVSSVLIRDSSTYADSVGSTDVITSYGNGVCNNAVVGAYFSIFTDSTQTSVKSISVNYVLMNIVDNGQSNVPQQFSVSFYTATPTARSGNPGYANGKNLLFLNSGSLSYLQFQGKSSTGTCSSTYISGPILTYGQSTIYSCYLSMNYDELKSFCLSNPNIPSQPIFSNHLAFKSIGKWGVSSQGNADDWISIDEVGTTSTSWNAPYCVLSNTLVYDIYYADLGDFSNPQAKIVAAKRYYNTGTWAFSGGNTANSQNFVFSVVVNFIPYDTRYDPAYQGVRIDTIMPQNVLQPFRTSFTTKIVFYFMALVIHLV